MPSLIVEDIAPFLSYSPGDWRLGENNLRLYVLMSHCSSSKYIGHAAEILNRSSGGSITATENAGATVSFKFYGTSVAIFGSSRPEFGNYSVRVDDTPFEVKSGRSDRETWHQTLFSVDNLPKGDHVVSLENVEARRRDLDYVRYFVLFPSLSEL